jgi:dephospho-CoA kinase
VRRLFVVVSGLPGSGKTTLGRRLAPALDLPLIDKDDILNRLFESKGIGTWTWTFFLNFPFIPLTCAFDL